MGYRSRFLCVALALGLMANGCAGLRVSPPQNSAVRACRNYHIIGICPAPVLGAWDMLGARDDLTRGWSNLA